MIWIAWYTMIQAYTGRNYSTPKVKGYRGVPYLTGCTGNTYIKDGCFVLGNPDHVAPDTIYRNSNKTPKQHQQHNSECGNP